MGYPAAYMHNEKNFLQDVFNRHADIKAAFAACEAIYPSDRVGALRETMTHHPRRIWRDLGIPEAHCETLADHVGRMALLSYRHPSTQYDPKFMRDMIDVWALPLTVADEIPLEDMDRKERHLLRSLAARLVFADHTERDAWQTWDNLASFLYDESSWIHDLDHIATACQANEYKSAYPHLDNELNATIHCCRQALLTKQGHTAFASALGLTPVTTRPRLAA